MKRFLILLAAALIAFSTAAAAAYDEKAISAMTELGIIPDDEELLGESITRGEFAGYICGLLRYNENEELIADSKPYDDVELWDSACGSISYLKQLGIVSGSGDNRYYPEDKITYGAACKILTAAAGYGAGYSDSFGTYPNSFIKAAAKLGITDGAALGADSEVTLKTAAVMFYNLLDVPYPKLGAITEEGDVVLDREKTFSEAVMKLYRLKGRLNADKYIALCGDAPGELEAVVDTTVYRIGRYYTEYIGRTVEGYAYDDESGDKKQIVWLTVRGDDESVVIYDEYITDFKNGVYTYRDSDTGRTKRTSVPSSAPVIYNYAVTGRDDIMIPSDGEVRIVKDNGSISAVIVTEYKNYYVEWADSLNKRVETSLKETVDLSDSDVEFFTAAGKSAGFDSIKKGSIISIAANSAAPSKVICIISNNVKTAAVNGVSTDDFDRAVLDTNDGEYIIQTGSPAEEEYGSYNGQMRKLYLDHEGKVFFSEAASDVTDGVYRYGYLIKVLEDIDTNDIIFKLLDQDGNIYRYSLKDKVSIDNTRMEKEAVFYRFMYNDEEKITARQVIRYSLSDNMIAKVQTGKEYSEGSRISGDLLIRANAKRYYYKPNGTFKRLLPINDADRLTPEIIVSKNPVVFMVPSEMAMTRKFDDSEFRTVNLASVMSEDKACWIKAYNTDSERLDDDLIVYYHEKGSVFGKSDPYIMVTKVTTLYDEKRETTVTRLTGMGNNKEFTFDAEDLSLFRPNGYKIKSGDLVRVITNDVDNLAEAVELVFTPDYDGSIMGENRSVYPDKTGRERNLSYSLIYGRIEKSNNGNISVLHGSAGITDREYFPVSSIPIYVYDSDNAGKDGVYRGNADDLRAGERVCIVNFWAKPAYMFVYLRD